MPYSIALCRPPPIRGGLRGGLWVAGCMAERVVEGGGDAVSYLVHWSRAARPKLLQYRDLPFPLSLRYRRCRPSRAFPRVFIIAEGLRPRLRPAQPRAALAAYRRSRARLSPRIGASSPPASSPFSPGAAAARAAARCFHWCGHPSRPGMRRAASHSASTPARARYIVLRPTRTAALTASKSRAIFAPPRHPPRRQAEPCRFFHSFPCLSAVFAGARAPHAVVPRRCAVLPLRYADQHHVVVVAAAAPRACRFTLVSLLATCAAIPSDMVCTSVHGAPDVIVCAPTGTERRGRTDGGTDGRTDGSYRATT